MNSGHSKSNAAPLTVESVARVGQIIVGALILGVLIFAAVVLLVIPAGDQTDGLMITYVMAGMAAMTTARLCPQACTFAGSTSRTVRKW